MNYVKKLFQSSDKQEYETARKKCITYVEKRRDCWKESVSGNKNTEQCFVEELAEKKCMSECLCKDIYLNFYVRSSCHLWAESFAHKDIPKYRNAKEQINKNKEIKEVCKALTLQLSHCISKYMKYSDEGAEGHNFVKNRST